MARPRKPEDPERYAEPCGRCGLHYPIARNWPGERVCGYCYQAAKRVTGTCPSCGHVGVLPSRRNGETICRSCSGIKINIDCRRCGAETELYKGGTCWTCVLAETVDSLLTNLATGKIDPALEKMASALKSMKRCNSGLTWIQQPHVAGLLEQLAVQPDISHAALDQLPGSRTLTYVRALLVEHGALPPRNELAERYEHWASSKINSVTDDDHRDALRRYITWHLLRRMRGMDAVPFGTFLRSKQNVAVAAEFLNWLTQNDWSLNGLGQAQIDLWQATGPTTREYVSRFLAWAEHARLTPTGIKVTPHRRGTGRRMPVANQQDAITKIVYTDELLARDRLAAQLILIFGQRTEHIVRLRWSDIQSDDDEVTITLGSFPIKLHPPMDEPVRKLLAALQPTRLRERGPGPQPLTTERSPHTV